jgi:TPR repeat protein
MRGCNNLAALYLRGVGVPDGADPVRARELFMRACEGQNGLGCSNLGQLYELGTGISADVVRASQLYERACELGAGAGCYRLALLYESGRGVDAVDADRGRQLRSEGCTHGYAPACAPQ